MVNLLFTEEQFLYSAYFSLSFYYTLSVQKVPPPCPVLVYHFTSRMPRAWKTPVYGHFGDPEKPKSRCRTLGAAAKDASTGVISFTPA